MAIDLDKLVCADAVEGWSMSLFGKPKLMFRCGSCHSTWRTRDWFMIVPPYGVSSTCTACRMVNYTGLDYGPDFG